MFEGPIIIAGIADFYNVSYPDLTEIIGYLVIYNVAGLKSIGQLFPNLTRIHGNQLVRNYAFIVRENPDLEMIGLTKLKSITRGAVRIEENDMLCFVDTVNWTMIVHSDYVEENYFRVSQMKFFLVYRNDFANIFEEKHDDRTMSNVPRIKKLLECE